MTHPSDPHEPSPEFRAHMQWQIETALRRESRLAAPVGGRLRGFRTAVVVLIALALGGAGGLASAHVQDARQRNRLVEGVRAEMQLTQTRLELAQAEYRDVKQRHEVGLAGRESIRAAEHQLRAMEAALARLQLDLQEIQATAAPPRDDLDAPLVAQRDFVRDRLHLELGTTQRAMAAAEEIVAQLRGRAAVGTASRAALAEAEAGCLAVRRRTVAFGRRGAAQAIQRPDGPAAERGQQPGPPPRRLPLEHPFHVPPRAVGCRIAVEVHAPVHASIVAEEARGA